MSEFEENINFFQLNKQGCETCGYAVWDKGDPSVGMGASIEDCKCEIPGIQEHFEKSCDDPEYACPFHAMIYEREWEKTRCKECNSPNTKYIKHAPSEYDDYLAEYSCNDCNEKFIADVRMW